MVRKSRLRLGMLICLLVGAFILAPILPTPTVQAQTLVGTLTVGGLSYGAAYDSSKGEVFVANYDAGTVSVISDATNSVVATVNVGGNPYGVAYDSAKGEVFVANSGDGTISIISDATNAVVSTVTVGSQPDGIAYDSSRGEVFVANTGDSTVSVISDTTNTVVASVSAGSGADAVAYDSSNREIFVTDYTGAAVSIISDSTYAVVTTVPVGTQPDGIAYDSSKGEVFVVNGGDGTISVINDATNGVLATVNVGTYPIGIAYDSGKGEVFVANSGDGTISVINDATNAVVATVGMGDHPSGFAYDPAKGEVFLAHSAGASVSIISDAVSTVTATTTSATSSTNFTPTTSSKTTVACTTSATMAPSASSPGVGAWAPTNCYPTAVSSQSCATSGGYIYCVGGYDGSGPTSSIYFAPVSPGGVGEWTSTTDYPTPVESQSCDIAGGYIYCVGGVTGSDANGDVPTNAVYLAPISSSGVGAWHTTIGYPTVIDTQSCAISEGYIYCVGGFDQVRDSATSSLGTSSAVYFAPVYPGGVGAWVETTSYPATDEDQSCATSGGYLYCVGGFTVSTTNDSSGITYVPGLLSAVYYAPVSSTGVGTWLSTSNYATSIFGQSCTISGGLIYCVGGDTVATGSNPTGAVYYAPVSSIGVGAWVPTTSYPMNDESQSCGISGESIYCVGGFASANSTNAVCYAQIVLPGSTSSAPTQSTPSYCSPLSTTSSSTSTATQTAQSSGTAQSSATSSSSGSLALSSSYLALVAIEVLAFLALFMLGIGRKRRKDS